MSRPGLSLAPLLQSAWANGRACAEVAFLQKPPPWTTEEAEEIFVHMADAMMQSFPGGPNAFIRYGADLAFCARQGFDERLRELMAAPAPEGAPAKN